MLVVLLHVLTQLIAAILNKLFDLIWFDMLLSGRTRRPDDVHRHCCYHSELFQHAMSVTVRTV